MASRSLFTPQPSMDDDCSQISIPDTAPYPRTPDYSGDCAGVEAYGENREASNTALVAAGGQQEPLVDWARLDPSSIPQEIPARILLLAYEEVDIFPYGLGGSGGTLVEVDMVGSPEGSEPAEVYAVGPETEQVGLCITRGETRYVMFFDPSDDRLIIVNKSPHSVIYKRLDVGDVLEVQSNASTVLTLGTWALGVGTDEWLIEFKLLARTPPHISQEPSTKRSARDETALTKRSRLSANQSTTRTAAVQGVSPGNPLLTIDRGEAIHVGAGESGYKLKRLGTIVDTRHSSIWKAEHSKMPGEVVAVKVIKPNSRRQESTIEAIEDWMRELSIHSSLGLHYAIVPYLGCDARFNAIFTKHIDAKSLIHHVVDEESFEFNGNSVRAWRILGDMASALSFLHANRIIHGDIKPANILFHSVHGAVLVDFNLSFREGDPAPGYGAPWYLPPEFLEDENARGSASDMWALGVVMMWVLRKIPMPELTRSWIVGDIHPDGPRTLAIHKKAQARMEDWINTVQAGNNELQEEGGEMANVVGMLVQQVKEKRSNAETLVQELDKCNLCTSD